jgi:hypothetical protein
MKKIIITEIEKNTIRLMYEDTKTPPSESILIANKNPFSDASKNILEGKIITEYNSNLKDGSLFYELDELKINDWALNILNELFYGKKVRVYYDGLTNSDEVLTIGKFTEITLKSYDRKKDNLVFDVAKTPNSMDSGFANGNTELYENGQIVLRNYGSSADSSRNMMITMYGSLMWSKVPDEFFQIRKIQRDKTDY